jgi:hypothetical protein
VQGIQVQHTGAGGQQVTTLVKSASVGAAGGSTVALSGGGQNVTIPVMPQIQKAMARNPQQMVQLRHHLMQQRNSSSKIIAHGGQILATGQQGQKVVAGAKGVPSHLIVSSGSSGQKQGAVTVQQIHQIVKPGGSGGQVQQQQLIPHTMLQAKAVVSSGSTVQARVIPVSASTVGGRPQQFHVVAAAQGVRQASPNVTVDASGRPTTTTTNNAMGSQIRVAAGTTQQQLFNQVLSGSQPVSVAVRTPAGNVISQAQATSSASTTKLQVVHPQSNNTDQNG